MKLSDLAQIVSYPFAAVVAAVVAPLVILVLGLIQETVTVEFRAWPLKFRIEVKDDTNAG